MADVNVEFDAKCFSYALIKAAPIKKVLIINMRVFKHVIVLKQIKMN
jgi:hypothetical protein